MPVPPRNLSTVDKQKYRIERYMEGGQVKEHLRNEAYEKYYGKKFESMREKKAMSIYQDFLSRVKNTYAQKKQVMLVDKSQFNNFN